MKRTARAGSRRHPLGPAPTASPAGEPRRVRLPARDARRRAHLLPRSAISIPRRPILTLLYDREAVGARFERHADQDLATPAPRRQRRRTSGACSPSTPLPRRTWPVPDCEVLISSSSAFAHGFKVPPGAMHVCYCHNPFRYAWNERERKRLAERTGLWPLRAPMRRPAVRDPPLGPRGQHAGRPLHRQLAGSPSSASPASYGRESAIVYPPVETERFSFGEPGEELLVVSEIVARQAGPRRARGGPACPRADRRRGLRARPRRAVRGLPGGPLPGPRRRRGARRLCMRVPARVLVPAMEEFGITAVEAQAAGRPVIAARAGGALETVLDGRTGVPSRSSTTPIPSSARSKRSTSSRSARPRRWRTPSASRWHPVPGERIERQVHEALETAGG